MNGDGYSDVVVGAYGNTSFTGKAYLYLGGASGLSASPSWTAVGEAASDDFGYSVATAGDVNGDGYSDVVVGALRQQHRRARARRTCTWVGERPVGERVVDAVGEAAGDYFGIPWRRRAT